MAVALKGSERGDWPGRLTTNSESALDAGSLPVEQLALLALREGRRPVAIYHAHRWFARRFSSVFRAILIAARTPPGADFWANFYQGVDYAGLTVLDPFVGGGTSVVEAARLGASTVGVDIDPVACAITRFELNAHRADGVSDALEGLLKTVGQRLARYYVACGPRGERRQVLHGFWVQVVGCRGCGQVVEAHPHHQLAFEAEGTRQWAFCRACHAVHELDRSADSFRCRRCRKETVIAVGRVDHGDLVCPCCLTREPLIDVAERTHAPPRWRLFALETLGKEAGSRPVPMTRRHFQAASDQDRGRVRAARRTLQRRRLPGAGWRWVPQREIPRRDRSDDRLLAYGYAAYHELFNPRQLLHLSCLAEAIATTTTGRVREALALAFSDHLATNCMLTYYAFGWRRLAPLFSIRAFRHVCRPVEINPWLDGTGRGTFPNAVRQVQRAVDFARAPAVAHLDGGFLRSGSLDATEGQTRHVVQGDSRTLARVRDNSIDLILTDPPYFDNIAYSELSDFFLPWLQAFGLAPSRGREARLPINLAARSRGEEGLIVFQRGLARCFLQMRRVLKDEGRLVFSYQHRTPKAWSALAYALAAGGWCPVQVFPMLGNSTAGPHQHEGTITWDAVSVYRKGMIHSPDDLRITRAAVDAAARHASTWSARLARRPELAFRPADRTNLWRACLVAGALGMFETEEADGSCPLCDVLVGEFPDD